MKYRQYHDILKSTFDLDTKEINIPSLRMTIKNIPFESYAVNLLPGQESYHCLEHNKIFSAPPDLGTIPREPALLELLQKPDSAIEENRKFNYSVIFSTYRKNTRKQRKNLDKKTGKPALKGKWKEKSSGAIILLHGLNEKDWSKYLPWAAKLIELTGKTVILFPIAFHMNRAPAEWGIPRKMSLVCQERKKSYWRISHSSFANSAISARLQVQPQRLLWSGLQSYFDLVQLLREIKSGFHPLIDKRERVDIFAYSIGVFLAQILLMSNPYNFFSESRLFCFCGGPTLNRMSPTSRYILDSEANIAVYSFFIEHLEQELTKDERLQHYLSKLHPEGAYFRCMLDYHKMKSFREDRLREISRQIAAIALKQDAIVPASEVAATLRGENRDIPIRLRVLDFPFAYDHVIPFPLSSNQQDEVEKAFRRIFKAAAGHYR